MRSAAAAQTEEIKCFVERTKVDKRNRFYLYGNEPKFIDTRLDPLKHI